MKKFLFILSLLSVLTLASCSSDNEPENATATLNVKELVSYVGKQASYVKDNFKSGKFQTEGGTLGKTTLSYNLPTKNVNYSVTFKSNTQGEITNIAVYGKYSSYSQGVELYKAEMDKINSTISYVSYIARYNNGVTMDFKDRSEFWGYVEGKDVSKFIEEVWWIENTATVKFKVDATYGRSTNSVSIDIEKEVW